MGGGGLYGPLHARAPDLIEAKRAGLRWVKAQRHVLRVGEPADHIFTIRAGWAARYITSRDGRRQILEFLTPGDPISFEIAYAGEWGLERALLNRGADRPLVVRVQAR